MNNTQKKAERKKVAGRIAYLGTRTLQLVTERGPTAETEAVEGLKPTGTTSLLSIANMIASDTDASVALGKGSDGAEIPSRSPKTGGPMGFALLNMAIATQPTLSKVECADGKERIYVKGAPPKNADWDKVNARRGTELKDAGF